jgi:putative component of toxin-antitoxin plasmid stabilization module
MTYAVYRTQKFDKMLAKMFSAEEQKQVEQFEQKQLVANPYVGDPLGYRFFREKKVGGRRVYYLVYEDIQAVLMVGVSDKKTQQETIDEIKERLNEYHEVIKEAIRQHGGSDRASHPQGSQRAAG